MKVKNPVLLVRDDIENWTLDDFKDFLEGKLKITSKRMGRLYYDAWIKDVSQSKKCEITDPSKYFELSHRRDGTYSF